MKISALLIFCLFVGCFGGCFGGGTGTPTGGAPSGPANPGSVTDGGAPGSGVGDTAAAGPVEGVTPVEDHQDIEEDPEYDLEAVDDTVETAGGRGLEVHGGGKVVMKGLVEKLATLDGQIAFDGPYAIAPAGEKILLVLFSDPSGEVVEYRACVTTLKDVEPVTSETVLEEALKRRNLDVTFTGHAGWYVRLFAIPWTDTGAIVDCGKKVVSVPASLSVLEEPDGYYLKTFPLVGVSP